MKKFAFLALLFSIYYVAGMYESMALMVFFLTLFLLMAVMFLLSFYLKRHIRASFMDQIVYAEKGEPFEWRHTDAENRRRRTCGLYGNSISGLRRRLKGR